MRRIVSSSGYKEMLKLSAAASKKLFVVLFTDPSSCQPCEAFAPFFESIADRFSSRGVVFYSVDGEAAPAVFQLCGVRAIPVARLISGGASVGKVEGADPEQLQALIARHLASAPAPAPLPALTDGAAGAGGGGGGSHIPTHTGAATKSAYHYNYARPEVKVFDDGSRGGEEEEEEPAEEEFWAALEEVCAEMGLSLEQMRDLLRNSADFPSAEMVDRVLAKTGGKSAVKARGVLGKQRAKVLADVEEAIRGQARARAAAEAAQMRKVQAASRALTRCPMNFEWQKVEGGYRCLGGSHFCTDEQISQFYSVDVSA